MAVTCKFPFLFGGDDIFNAVPTLKIQSAFDEETKHMHWIIKYCMTHISGVVPFQTEQEMINAFNNVIIHDKDKIKEIIKLYENNMNEVGYVVSNVFGGLIEVLDHLINGTLGDINNLEQHALIYLAMVHVPFMINENK